MLHHILFAERGPHSTGLLLSAQASSPIRVSTAHSGRTACAIIARDKPDGAFVDLQLPDISGLEVARHAAARGVPVVLRVPEAAKAAAVEKIGFACLVEPLKKPELIAAARMLIAAAWQNIAQLQDALRRLQRNQRDLRAVWKRLPGPTDPGAPGR
ncbi:MAG: hypothetical protein ACREFQ_06725, partial [Stellaceae bacterium]